jgi:hypothetical protein
MGFLKIISALPVLPELLYLLLIIRGDPSDKLLLMLQKIIVSAVSVLLISISANAQFKKGDKMAGASVGSAFFNSGSTDQSTSLASLTVSSNDFGISLTPSIGWFITDNVAIGIAPTVSYDKKKILGKSSGSTYLKDETSQFNFGVGGFTRYYFSGNSIKTRFFGQYDLSAGLGGSNDEGFQYETYGLYVDRYKTKSSGDFFVNTGVALGISKFLSGKTSLDFYIGYKFSYIKSNPKGTFVRDYTDPATGDVTQKPDYDQTFTGHNVVLGVGFQIFLDKSKK